MINDNTIDVQTARYWCMFMDQKVMELLDEAMSYSAEDGKKLAEIAQKVKDSKHFKESLDEGMWDGVQAVHQAAFPLAGGNPFQPNFRGMDPKSGELSLKDQGRNNVIAAATAAALVGASAVPGAWAALGSALSGALGAVGGWLAGTAASTAASIGTSGIAAIVGGLVSVSTYLYPRIAKALHEFGVKGLIAKCAFEADGQRYIASFYSNVKRWELNYADSRWFKAGVKVPEADVAAFFQTEFFRKFLAQCEKNVMKLYGDAKKMKAFEALAEMSDDRSKKDLKRVLDAEDAVSSYMLKGAYRT